MNKKPWEKRSWSGFVFRLQMAYKVLCSKKFVVNAGGDKTYIKGFSMNQLIQHHNELTNFIEKTISTANEQESAIREAEGIIKQGL